MSEGKPLIDGEEAQHLQRLKAYQPWAFFVTFGGYFMAHFSRKCYSTIKTQLEDDAGYSSSFFGVMDFVFMATYAAGNIINGKLGDTYNPSLILSIGLWGSGVCLFLMNVGIWFDFEGISEALGNWYMLAVYFCFGFLQATGGPVGTAVMGNWFCDAESVENRGTIFGFWTCHQYLGDMAAAFCTAAVLGAGLPYWWALLIPAAANVGWGFLSWQLIADPYTVGIVTPEVRIRQEKLEAKRKELEEQGEVAAADEGPQAITYADALRLPMVAQYCAAFGFFKLTNYVLFFWLPYFLENEYDPVTANLIASLYSFGMMPGGIIVGYVSDLYGGRRAAVIGTFMCALIVFFAFFAKYSESGMNPIVLLTMLACMGILVGGPNNIITSAVAADLASHPSVRGNAKSLGTITGLINGIGSVTASLGLLAIGAIQDKYGWGVVWVCLIVGTATGTLLMSSRIYAEIFPNA